MPKFELRQRVIVRHVPIIYKVTLLAGTFLLGDWISPYSRYSIGTVSSHNKIKVAGSAVYGVLLDKKYRGRKTIFVEEPLLSLSPAAQLAKKVNYV